MKRIISSLLVSLVLLGCSKEIKKTTPLEAYDLNREGIESIAFPNHNKGNSYLVVGHNRSEIFTNQGLFYIIPDEGREIQGYNQGIKVGDPLLTNVQTHLKVRKLFSETLQQGTKTNYPLPSVFSDPTYFWEGK